MRAYGITRRNLLLGAALMGMPLDERATDFAREADRLTDLVHRTFWDPVPAMYRAPVAGPETVASDAAHDCGYVLWPSIEMLHALVEGEAARKGRYRAKIAEVYDGLEKYRNADAHAYNAWLDFPGNVDRYYDDNAILARVLAKAYRATGERRYRDRARDIMDGFVRKGWDPTGKPGGMQWGVDPSRPGTGDRAACSTSMTSLAALELVSARAGDRDYVGWAEALMAWLIERLRDADGLISDALEPPDWRVRPVKWTYNTGMAIHAHVLLWRITRRASYLETARSLGEAALDRKGRMYDGLVKDPERNHWFDSSFFTPYLADGLVELTRATGDRRYADEVRRNAEFARRFLLDPADGLYFRNWRLWRIDAQRADTWRRVTGVEHPLEADPDERAKTPEALKLPPAQRPLVKSLLANAGMARLLRIAARA